MKKYKCMDCGTKQKVKEQQMRIDLTGDKPSFISFCAKCHRWRTMVGSEDKRYDQV